MVLEQTAVGSIVFDVVAFLKPATACVFVPLKGEKDRFHSFFEETELLGLPHNTITKLMIENR